MRQVKITYNYDVFMAFLFYLYSDRIAESSMSIDSRMILELSHRYNIKRLKFYLEKQSAKMLPSTLAEDFGRALNSKDLLRFADIKLVVNSTKVSCHRIFLITRCKYFQTMFCSDWKEKSVNEMKLLDIELEPFINTLRYFYTDALQVDPTEAVDILSVANLFQIPRLKNMCSSIIEKGVDSETVAYVYQAAKIYSVPSLIRFTLEVMASEFANVKKTEQYKKLAQEDKNDIEKFYIEFIKTPK